MNPIAAAFPLHGEACADVAATASQLFAQLDDHRKLSGHMESSSPMMAGSSMRIETDAQGGSAVGSHLRLAGRVLGMTLSVNEGVTEYDPPRRKACQTLGEPRLLVVGGYRMGFDVLPRCRAAACGCGSTTRCRNTASAADSAGCWAASMRAGARARCCAADCVACSSSISAWKPTPTLPTRRSRMEPRLRRDTVHSPGDPP